MDNFLKQNICGLPSYAAGRKHINGLTIDRCLPEHLQYSCCHWVYHLKQSHEPVKDEVCGFLEKHLLHWMETMSIMGMVLETVGILNTLMAVLMVSPDMPVLHYKLIMWENLEIRFKAFRVFT
jgi:uncharacterized membrane protein